MDPALPPAAAAPAPPAPGFFRGLIASVRSLFEAPAASMPVAAPGSTQAMVDGFIDEEIAAALAAWPGVELILPSLPAICDTVANNVVAKVFDRQSAETALKAHVPPTVAAPAAVAAPIRPATGGTP